MKNLKNLTILPIIGLAACGGGSDNETQRDIAPTRPSAQVSGTGFDGLIIEGDVSVSDFSNAISGGLLGTAKTDGVGKYEASIQSPNTAIRVALQNGFYIEEASGTEIPLDANKSHKLYAVDYYTSGSSVEVSATFFTTLATGLTEYLVQDQGLSTVVAIERAYAEIDAWAGFDTRRTTPLAVNDAANASPLLTNALKAGFVAAGISQLTRTVGNGDPHTTFSSIGFIQVAYEDIKADGILDGIGNGGDPLSYGNLLINANTYRTLLPTRLLQFVSTDFNQTGLTFDALLDYASNLNSYSGSLFNYEETDDITQIEPEIDHILPTDGTIAARTITLSSTATDTFGIASLEYTLGGESVVTLYEPPYVHNMDISTHSNGDYQLNVIATNYLGNTKTASNSITINNGSLSFVGLSERYNERTSDYIKVYSYRYECPAKIRVIDTTGLGVENLYVGGMLDMANASIPEGAADFYTRFTFRNRPLPSVTCAKLTATDNLGADYQVNIRVDIESRCQYYSRSGSCNNFTTVCTAVIDGC